MTAGTIAAASAARETSVEEARRHTPIALLALLAQDMGELGHRIDCARIAHPSARSGPDRTKCGGTDTAAYALEADLLDAILCQPTPAAAGLDLIILALTAAERMDVVHDQSDPEARVIADGVQNALMSIAGALLRDMDSATRRQLPPRYHRAAEELLQNATGNSEEEL